MMRASSSVGSLTALLGVGLCAFTACGGSGTGETPASSSSGGGGSGGLSVPVGGGSASVAGSAATAAQAAATGGAGSASGGSDSNGGAAVTGGSAGVSSGAANSDGAVSGAGVSSGGASSSGDVTWVPDPSWACGMPDGLVPPTRGELVFNASFDLGDVHDVGATQYGHRRVLDVHGGSVTGDKLQASLLTGGLDLELTLSNGSLELEQLYMLRASDNTLIYLRGCGLAPAGETTARFVPDFEVATSSALAWLNTGKFVGTRTVDTTAKTITLAVYDVSKVVVADPRTTFEVPADVLHQPWECSTTIGTKGDSVFTEAVGIGASLAVGASKRGTRNVIPITGGTVTGRVTGKVLPGGADFQIISGVAKLDARYTLASDDGEFVLVQNCGPIGALVPQFETRVAGPYAFLNANTFISSDPGSATGGVSITMYQRK